MTPPSGPVERALADVLAGLPALRELLGADAVPTVETCEQDKVGELKIDLGDGVPTTKAAAKAYCGAVAELLRGHPAIAEATAIPPRVFVRPSLPFLREAVTGAVLADPDGYGRSGVGAGRHVALVFSSPNANKPLHLGHLRNNFIGMALSGLHAATGHRVTRVCVLSDWGIHICQAALAWSKWGDGRSPEDPGVKGDRFVGDWYVRFHQEVARARRAAELPETSSDDDEVIALEREAHDLLRAADAGDGRAFALVQRIVGQAWRGIDATHRRIGTTFDVVLRERDWLPTSMGLIERGLRLGTCVRRADGSVYVDLPEIDTGEVTLVRRDGTPVVYTQLMGVHVYRYEHLRPDAVLLLLGHEWELGMDTIKKVLLRLGFAGASALEPLHYGMVSLSGGKMKSREGTVVETDGLIDRVRDRFAAADPALAGSAADTLAVALLGYHFLRIRRTIEARFDEDLIWTKSWPGFVRILRTMAAADAAAADACERPPPNRAMQTAWRKVLLGVNSLPQVLVRALCGREPSIVLRVLDDIASHAEHTGLADRGGTEWSAARHALGTALRRGLVAVGIRWPEPLGAAWSTPPG
jgi:arginyl-tRNA synthetase